MSTPTSSRGNPSMGDVVRSVVVLGIILLALYGISQFLFTSKPKSPVTPVDYASAAVAARQVAPYPLLAPRTLANGWYATTATYDAGPTHAWHLYVVTKQQESIGLEQGSYSLSAAVRRYAPHTRADGTIDIAGVQWDRRAGTGSSKGDTVLLRHAGSGDAAATTLVLGSGSPAVVESYVASLSSTLPTPSPSASPTD